MTAALGGAVTGAGTADAVLFDLGGVVLAWEPARAYEQVLPADEVPALMGRIGFAEWNRQHDAGRSYAEAEADLVARHPDDEVAILAYRRHFMTTLTGLVPGTGAIIAELAAAGIRLGALTNWSAETFPLARDRFRLLRRFVGIVVSGQERLAKPDPRAFELALTRFGFRAESCVFVDDSPANVEAARRFGLTGLHFTGAEPLRNDLVALGLLGERAVVEEPVYHLTERARWEQAQSAGAYLWSGRDRSYDEEGFVHAGFAGQLLETRQRKYGDLADEALVVLELDPARLTVPLVVEDLGSGRYPHLYGPLPVEDVRAVHPYPLP